MAGLDMDLVEEIVLNMIEKTNVLRWHSQNPSPDEQ